MITPALNSTEADRYIKGRFANSSVVPNTHEIGHGSRDPWERCATELRARLGELLHQYEEHDAHAFDQEFDSRAASIIHRALGLDDRTAADDDFWRYVACVEAFDAIVWRHGRKDEEQTTWPNAAHFGLGDKWDCFPRRLWFRAELSRDPARTDPYELSKRGGMDFWTSGLLRVLYSCSRPVARALVRFQFPHEGKFRRGSYRPQTLALNGVRELYKRLRHFNATIALPALGDEAAVELVRSLSEGLERDPSGEGPADASSVPGELAS